MKHRWHEIVYNVNMKYGDEKFLYTDLTYKIIGILYDVHNKLGSGYQEKYYCRAINLALKKVKIPYKEQVFFAIRFEGEKIGHYFADFIVDHKVILEIKVNPRIYPQDQKQLLGYLKESGLRLGILASFTKRKVIIKRYIL